MCSASETIMANGTGEFRKFVTYNYIYLIPMHFFVSYCRCTRTAATLWPQLSENRLIIRARLSAKFLF